MPLAAIDSSSTQIDQPSSQVDNQPAKRRLVLPPGEVDQPLVYRLVQRLVLDNELQEFIIDRQARNLTPKTILWYRTSLAIFRAYCQRSNIASAAEVTPGILRHFILELQQGGHNPGGVKNIYGAVKAFINWYADESPPVGWVNPTLKVHMPRTPDAPLDPLSMEHLKAMLATCRQGTFAGSRDKALLLFLLDSGVRHQELHDLNIGDVNMSTGAVMVRCGKGRKPRSTFIGAKSRKALLVYMRYRPGVKDDAPIWVTGAGQRLSYSGIRQVIRRRAKQAGIPEPSLHSFRRAFAIGALRNGCDLVTLQRLLGHSGLAVITRYLKQVDGDLQAAHAKASPVDRML